MSSAMEEIVTYTSGDLSGPPELRILHYNDVYHIDASSREPVGGIGRFKTLCDYYKGDDRFKDQPELLTYFSGDAFNPSLESSVTKGSHMVEVLNTLRTDVACVGNHDLDFGVQQFQKLAGQCNFPWLLANVLDPDLGDNIPLGNAQKTFMMTSSNGIKIGLIGLVEREWLDTIHTTPPNLIYKSASATAEELVPGLREQGAEIIIAITHQREPNDNKLAEKTSRGLIDIVLGGHDHFYRHSLINDTHVLRSGSDFKQLSYIEARKRKDQKWDFHIVRRNIVSGIPQDPQAVALAAKLNSSMTVKLDKPIGYTAAPLDARFTTMRNRESNMGNFVCDLMRAYYEADCAIMTAGTVRGDQIYPPGVFRVRDMMHCFPFEDPLVVLRITGQAVLAALENAVSLYPALEGRFPQVSNIKFEFDPREPAQKRIKWVTVGGQPLDLSKKYSVVTMEYMSLGKDGFSSLRSQSEGGVAEEIVNGENGVLISIMVRQYFLSLKTIGKWKMWSGHMQQHWDGVHDTLHETQPVLEPTKKPEQNGQPAHGDSLHHDSDDDGDHVPHDTQPQAPRRGDRELYIARKVIRKWWRLAKLPGQPRCMDEVNNEEFAVSWTRAIAPRLEGRIKMVAEAAA